MAKIQLILLLLLSLGSSPFAQARETPYDENIEKSGSSVKQVESPGAEQAKNPSEDKIVISCDGQCNGPQE